VNLGQRKAPLAISRIDQRHFGRIGPKDPAKQTALNSRMAQKLEYIVCADLDQGVKSSSGRVRGFIAPNLAALTERPRLNAAPTILSGLRIIGPLPAARWKESPADGGADVLA